MADPVLELRGLNKFFGALTATSNLSLTVMPGEIHALIGPNGAGKTTLIQQIYGALKPDSGQIFLNGRDLTGLSVPDRIRAGIGRSFQIWRPDQHQKRETDFRDRAAKQGVPRLTLGRRPEPGER